MSKRRKLLTLVGVSLVAAAVATGLRKPPDAPGNATVFTPHILGVGWSVNLGRLARRAGIA